VTLSAAVSVYLGSSYPSSDTVWTAGAYRQGGRGGVNWQIQAYAVCAAVA